MASLRFQLKNSDCCLGGRPREGMTRRGNSRAKPQNSCTGGERGAGRLEADCAGPGTPHPAVWTLLCGTWEPAERNRLECTSGGGVGLGCRGREWH